MMCTAILFTCRRGATYVLRMIVEVFCDVGSVGDVWGSVGDVRSASGLLVPYDVIFSLYLWGSAGARRPLFQAVLGMSTRTCALI
jgi:hypothetical protein